MGYCQRHKISVTTNGSGAATAYTAVPVNGHIEAIIYVKGDFDNGSTMTVTGELTATAIWAESAVNASAIRYPRAATCDTVGAASLYAAGGEPVETRIPIADERVKIVIASGGATKAGTFYVLTS